MQRIFVALVHVSFIGLVAQCARPFDFLLQPQPLMHRAHQFLRARIVAVDAQRLLQLLSGLCPLLFIHCHFSAPEQLAHGFRLHLILNPHQVEREILRRGVAVFSLLSQDPADNRIQFRRIFLQISAERRRRIVQDLMKSGSRLVRFEWERASQQLKQNHSKRIHVRAIVELFGLQLLRGHVKDAANDLVGLREPCVSYDPGDSKINDHRHSIVDAIL